MRVGWGEKQLPGRSSSNMGEGPEGGGNTAGWWNRQKSENWTGGQRAGERQGW